MPGAWVLCGARLLELYTEHSMRCMGAPQCAVGRVSYAESSRQPHSELGTE